MRKLTHYIAMSRLPGDSATDARNDTGYTIPGNMMLQVAKQYNSGLANWLYLPGNDMDMYLRLIWYNDIPPVAAGDAGEPLAEHFEGRGLCVWRTGWDRSDVMFSVESGPYYIVTHDQADKGHFTLYGFGQRWACDAGYGNNRDPLGRCQTVAHNCILVDGNGQGLSGASFGTNGKIVKY